MIKISRADKPEQLVQEIEEKLTEKFAATGKPVWKQEYIREALLGMSHNKCCYCETKLGQTDSYMEVEHFHCKELYPKHVVQWDNLLPACKRCNGRKKGHDVKKEPLINPTVDVPGEHMYMSHYRLCARRNDGHKDLIAHNTITLLKLNDSERVFGPRVEVGDAAKELLEKTIDDFLHAPIQSGSNVEKIRIKDSIKALLQSAQPESKFSATVATVLVEDSCYNQLRSLLKKHGIWDDELECLEIRMMKIALTEKPCVTDE